MSKLGSARTAALEQVIIRCMNQLDKFKPMGIENGFVGHIVTKRGEPCTVQVFPNMIHVFLDYDEDDRDYVFTDDGGVSIEIPSINKLHTKIKESYMTPEEQEELVLVAHIKDIFNCD